MAARALLLLALVEASRAQSFLGGFFFSGTSTSEPPEYSIGAFTMHVTNPAYWTFEGFDYEQNYPPEVMMDHRVSFNVQGCSSEWLRCLGRVNSLEPVCALNVDHQLGKFYWDGYYSICELEYQNCWRIRARYEMKGYHSDYRQTKHIFDGLGGNCHAAAWWQETGYRRAFGLLSELVGLSRGARADAAGEPPAPPTPRPRHHRKENSAAARDQDTIMLKKIANK